MVHLIFAKTPIELWSSTFQRAQMRLETLATLMTYKCDKVQKIQKYTGFFLLFFSQILIKDVLVVYAKLYTIQLLKPLRRGSSHRNMIPYLKYWCCHVTIGAHIHYKTISCCATGLQALCTLCHYRERRG